MKGLKTGSIAALLALTVASGCATLKSFGVLDDENTTAACSDIAKACSAAVLVNADETVRTACAVLAAGCVAE